MLHMLGVDNVCPIAVPSSREMDADFADFRALLWTIAMAVGGQNWPHKAGRFRLCDTSERRCGLITIEKPSFTVQNGCCFVWLNHEEKIPN